MRDTLCRLAFVALLVASCGSPATQGSIVCMPACPAGQHCTEAGCVPDGAGSDMAAATGDLTMATACPIACVAPTPYCSPNKVCVPCLDDSQCPAGNVCATTGATSICVPGCTDDAGCKKLGPTQACCNKSCVDVARDRLF